MGPTTVIVTSLLIWKHDFWVLWWIEEMHGKWLILIVTDWKWVLFINCYKTQSVWMKGTKPLKNYVEYLLFCDGTVLDIWLLDSELVKYTVIVIWSWWLLVGASILNEECFMDHLINFMNSNCSPPLPLFHFMLITNPSHIPYSFFTPCSEIDYSQENLCVKVDESGIVLGGL